MRRQKTKAPKGDLSSVLGVVSLAALIAGVVLISVGTKTNDVRTHDYDYVIVGGGAAGAVVAERLSRSGRHSVLLIEAGPDEQEDGFINEFGFWARFIPSYATGRYFWQHAQERQRFSAVDFGNNEEFARGIPPPSIPELPAESGVQWQHSSGRVLGGNSKVNVGNFIRGTDWMFDQWANITNDPTWSAPNVLQVYKEIEKYHSMSFNPVRRGFSGPVSVVDQSGDALFMGPKLVSALVQLTNLTELEDYNDMFTASRLGPFVGWQVTTEPNMTRSSADVAILTPGVRQRKNLVISTESTANKVVFDSKKRARGVLYLHNGHEFVAHARERIVLTAGINNPSILQRSGVGPASVLESAGVPVLVDNSNVGRNLANHLKVTATFEKNSGDFMSESPAVLYEGGAFLPDPTGSTTGVRSPRQFQAMAVNNDNEMFLSLINLQPIATGFNEIISRDPLRVSEVDQIDDDDDGDYDVNMLAEGVRHYACKLHAEFQGYGHGPAIDTAYRLVDPPLEICNNTFELRDWVNYNMDPRVFQWSSSCRMGVSNTTSVTNSRGSVWGVTGLTVADRSIAPLPHDGDTSTLSYLIGSIIAEQIIAGNV